MDLCFLSNRFSKLCDTSCAEIIQSKRRRRYLERVWRKSRSSLDRSRYTRQCHLCNRQMSKAKSYYYENMVANNSATPKTAIEMPK